jgi:hypothetical protein
VSYVYKLVFRLLMAAISHPISSGVRSIAARSPTKRTKPPRSLRAPVIAAHPPIANAPKPRRFRASTYKLPCLIDPCLKSPGYSSCKSTYSKTPCRPVSKLAPAPSLLGLSNSGISDMGLHIRHGNPLGFGAVGIGGRAATRV